MAVIQPTSPSHPLLPCTKEELHKIEGHVPCGSPVELGVLDVLASAEYIISSYSYVHSALDVPQPTTPLKSA